MDRFVIRKARDKRANDESDAFEGNKRQKSTQPSTVDVTSKTGRENPEKLKTLEEANVSVTGK